MRILYHIVVLGSVMLSVGYTLLQCFE